MAKKITLNRDILRDNQNKKTEIEVSIPGHDNFTLNVYSCIPLEKKAAAVNLIASGCFVDIDGAVKPSIEGIEFLHGDLTYNPSYVDTSSALGILYAFTDLDVSVFETIDDVDLFVRFANARRTSSEEYKNIMQVISDLIQINVRDDVLECAYDLINDYRKKLNGALIPITELSIGLNTLFGDLSSILKKISSFMPDGNIDTGNISNILSNLAGMEGEDLINALIERARFEEENKKE